MAMGLIVGQTVLVSQVNAVKELNVECEGPRVIGGIEVRYCCLYETDTDDPDQPTRVVECWNEYCDIETGECETGPVGTQGDNIPNGLDRPIGEGAVLPVPPSPENEITTPDKGEVLQMPPSPGSFVPRVTERPLDDQEAFQVPPETTTQEDTGATDRPTDEKELLQIPLGIVKETAPLQQLPVEEVEDEHTDSETMPEREDCSEGEIFNEQLAQCESIGEQGKESPEDIIQDDGVQNDADPGVTLIE